MMDWEESLFLEGEDKLCEHFAGKEQVLMILGKGFDPRACVALQTLISVVEGLTVFLIDYDDQTLQRDDVNESRSRTNEKVLNKICQTVHIEVMAMPQYRGVAPKRELIISESVRRGFAQQSIDNYENVIIDISAMPRAVAFSIIKRLYDIKSENQKISILACENSECDDLIEPVIAEGSAVFLPGFQTFSMQLEATVYDTIWIPMLGMREEKAFNIISNYIKPVEICPVVPFPASDIRRGERILRSHGDIIFRERDVEKRNIIYVPEKYPLLIYQKLYETVKYYEKAFSLNATEDKCMKYVFSSQSSKLMDIGMVLAVMKLCKEEINTGIVVVDNQGYQMINQYNSANNELYCLCLDENVFGWN